MTMIFFLLLLDALLKVSIYNDYVNIYIYVHFLHIYIYYKNIYNEYVYMYRVHIHIFLLSSLSRIRDPLCSVRHLHRELLWAFDFAEFAVLG